MKYAKLVNRVKEIDYQILKNFDSTNLSDQQKIDMTLSLLVGIMKNATGIVDSELPTTFFGSTLDWSVGTLNDKVVKVTKGNEVIQHDLSNNYRRITVSEMLILALSIIRAINGGELAPDIGYIKTNPDIIAEDALSLVLNIN